MSSANWNRLFGANDFDAVGAAIMLDGLRAVSETDYTTWANDFKNSVGAVLWNKVNPPTLGMPTFVFQFYPLAFLVLIPGISTARQVIAFLNNSDTSAYPTITHGAVSEFYRSVYEDYRSTIGGYIGTGRGRLGVPIAFGGHSAGGGIVQCILADIAKNYYPEFSVKPSYIFGSPRVGNATFASELDIFKLFNIRNETDPINLFPNDRNDIIFGDVSASNIVTDFFLGSVRYSTAGTKYLLTSTALGAVGEFERDNKNNLQIFFNYLNAGQLPTSHQLYRYWQNMGQHAGTGGDVQEAQTNRDIMQNFGIPTPQVANPDTLVPNNSLPSLSTITTTQPTDSAGRIQAVPRVINITGMPTLVPGVAVSKRRRAGVHDGRAMRQLREVLTRLQSIERHDARAAAREHQGTVVLRNPCYWGAGDETAYERIVERLNEIVNSE